MKKKGYTLFNTKEQGYGRKHRWKPTEFVAIVWEQRFASLYSKAEASFLILLHGSEWIMEEVK